MWSVIADEICWVGRKRGEDKVDGVSESLTGASGESRGPLEDTLSLGSRLGGTLDQYGSASSNRSGSSDNDGIDVTPADSYETGLYIFTSGEPPLM